MRMRLTILFLGILYCLSVLPARGKTDSPARIPVYDLMQDPLIDDVKISPDGKTIATLYNNNDRIMVLVKDLMADNSEPLIINVLNHNVKWLEWANNQRIITGTTVEGGIWHDYYALVVMD